MKKIIFTISTCIVTLFVFNACSDYQFDNQFPDPSKTNTVTVEKIMTGTFEKGNLWTMPWYWRYYTFDLYQMGRYAQVAGRINGNGMYEPNDGWNDRRWTDFYQMIAQYRLLEDTWEKMDESQKGDYVVFKHITTIFVYDHLQQIVDLWGDVPFTKAGYVGISMDIRGSKPAYDDPVDLYKMMITDLKEINTFLAGYSPSAFINSLLKAQDYINNGDLVLWRKYCNSLRLRLASRVAENGSLTTEARSILKEMLEDPATYPVVTGNDDAVRINFQAPKLTAVEGQHEEGIKGGFESSASGHWNRCSKIFVDALDGDPRLEIILEKNSDGIYVGVDPLMDGPAQEKLFNRPLAEGGNYFSAVDTATFSRNNKFPGLIITAAEVDFIRAEAIQKWGVNGSAEEAFKKGVKNSIELYYYLNSLGDYRDPLPVPSTADVDAFVAQKWNDYSSKEEAIAVQRWIHQGLIQTAQCWHEYRKTGYPRLQFLTDNGSILAPTPPHRLLYTVNEKNYNTENYNAVQEKDDRYRKLFWAK